MRSAVFAIVAAMAIGTAAQTGLFDSAEAPADVLDRTNPNCCTIDPWSE